MQSVKSTQADLDNINKEGYEEYKEQLETQIAQEQRNELLSMLFYPIAIVGFFALVIKLGIDGQNGNWRPLFYWLGFMALGLPLRVIFRAGRDDDQRPGVIATFILALITLIVFLIVGYGLYLRDERIYQIVLTGSHLSSYLQSRFSVVRVDGLFLLLYAFFGVVLVVFPTDGEFGQFINAMMRGRSRKYHIR
jgi:hypothetical protein